MKLYKNVTLLDVFSWTHFIEDVRITRISPKSYHAGEHSGFMVGITAGVIIGFALTFMLFAHLSGP